MSLLPLGTLPHLEGDLLLVGCVSDEHARAQPAEPGARVARGLQLLDQRKLFALPGPDLHARVALRKETHQSHGQDATLDSDLPHFCIHAEHKASSLEAEAEHFVAVGRGDNDVVLNDRFVHTVAIGRGNDARRELPGGP